MDSPGARFEHAIRNMVSEPASAPRSCVMHPATRPIQQHAETCPHIYCCSCTCVLHRCGHGGSTSVVTPDRCFSNLDCPAVGDWELCGDRFYARHELYTMAWGDVRLQYLRCAAAPRTYALWTRTLCRPSIASCRELCAQDSIASAPPPS